MSQDSPKRRPGRAKSDERELQDAKWEMLILALFFSMKMRSWRVWLGSSWAHVEVMCAHLGDLRRSWSTWTEILEDLVGVISGTFGDHVGSCWSLEAPFGHLGAILEDLGLQEGKRSEPEALS